MDKQYWKDLISYALIRAAVWPFSLIPLQWLRACGKGFGNLAFYCLREYRKRTLSNLSLANDLAIAEKDVCKIARESFQNLAINCLEYAKFSRLRDLSTFIRCENPEVADALYQQKQGIIFFCGHQSNWEVLFLDGTRRMEGI
ncbi:MAG: acyltransferase, partial [Chlamydiota bacterium]